MPRYMLDTNMCIYLIRHQPPEVAARFAECRVGDVVMSAVTFAELSYGVEVAADPQRERANLESLVEDIPVAPLDTAAGIAYGVIRIATRDVRRDHLDKLIAAHAVSLGVALVTNNRRDFARYPGLVIENWLSRPSL